MMSNYNPSTDPICLIHEETRKAGGGKNFRSTAVHVGRRWTETVRRGALGSDMLGEFGARDPFPAELESGFGEKVLGNASTEHNILILTASPLSLANLDCRLVSPSDPPLSDADADAQKLLNKVVGWRLANNEGSLRLQCLWKLKDSASAVELISRIRKAVENMGHHPDLHIENSNHVRAELWTSAIGGLSINDFIVADKIDKIKTLDLLPRKRIWA